MSNQTYGIEMYNEDLKERFLNEHSEQYKRIFVRSVNLEKTLSKDLAEFNLPELEDFFYSLYPKTTSSSRTNISAVATYITWAIRNGYRENNINPLDVINTEWAEKFVDKSIMMYISKGELDEVIEKTVNAQDSVIALLLWEGVDVHEIRFMKSGDIEEDTNTLLLRNDKGEVYREHTVSDKCLYLIKRAIREDKYTKNNGDYDPHARSDGESPLIDNDYVIRPVKRGNEDTQEVKQHVIYSRLKTLAEYFDLPYFTSKNILRSGMIYMGYELLQRDGELDKEQYLEICEAYNVKKVKNNGYYYHNWSPLKEFINTENIRRLYGEQ